MTKLRHVVIGAGANVFSAHRPGLELETSKVVGVADLNVEAAEKVAAEMDCPHFTDYRVMLDETQPDVAVVMTPHPFHPSITIDCLEASCHVLVEKPIAVHVQEADAMVRAAEQAGRLLAVNFQQRLRPEIIAARKLIQEGRLGKIQQVDVKVTWTRTAIYYTLVNWRGTWAGEGGGVLMNQAPHELDLICHLVGMPLRLFAWTRTLSHQIETEDTVQAMLEWKEGALGSFHASTAEAGLSQRFEIIGTGGHLEIGRGALKFSRFGVNVDEFITTSDQPFASPSLQEEIVSLEAGAGDHKAIYQNLHSAILQGTPLIADGVSGTLGLELANAMNYSSHTDQVVEFPLDRQAYADLLADLKAGRIVADR